MWLVMGSTMRSVMGSVMWSQKWIICPNSKMAGGTHYNAKIQVISFRWLKSSCRYRISAACRKCVIIASPVLVKLLIAVICHLFQPDYLSLCIEPSLPSLIRVISHVFSSPDGKVTLIWRAGLTVEMTRRYRET